MLSGCVGIMNGADDMQLPRAMSPMSAVTCDSAD